MQLFSVFESFNLMTSWRSFCIKPLEHSHVFNLYLFFVRIEPRVSVCPCVRVSVCLCVCVCLCVSALQPKGPN